MAAHRFKKFARYLNVTPKNVSMLPRQTLLLVFSTTIKLHENTAASCYTKILNCNILSKKTYTWPQHAIEIWYLSLASTTEECIDYLFDSFIMEDIFSKELCMCVNTSCRLLKSVSPVM